MKNHVKSVLATLAVAVSLNSASRADYTTINFDTLAPGTIVGRQYERITGVRFDRKDLQNHLVGFGTLYVQANQWAASPNNVLSIGTGDFATSYVRGVFSSPAHRFVGAYVGVMNSGTVVVTLTAYDAANNQVGMPATATLSTSLPYGWAYLSVTAPGAATIAKFTIDGGVNPDVVVDDIRFDSVPCPYCANYPAPIDLQALLQQAGAPAPDGSYDFQFSLFNQQTAAMPISGVITERFPVANGLLNAPLSFSPDVFWGQPLFMDVSIKGPSDATFTPIGPRLPIAPAPQAIYAYSAGSVLALDEGQAVTSLNGLTDAVQLQAGFGITLTTSSNNTIVISRSTTASVPSGPTPPTVSAAASPDPVPAQLATLKSQNEALEKKLNQLEQALQSIAGKN